MSLENNNYPQAIEDLAKSVTIKTKVVPAGSRFYFAADLVLEAFSLSDRWPRPTTRWVWLTLGQVGSSLMIVWKWLGSGEWAKAEESLTAAISVLTARISSHSAEKEALENIVHEIKGRIADLKDMEKGVFTNTYVTVPGKI